MYAGAEKSLQFESIMAAMPALGLNRGQRKLKHFTTACQLLAGTPKEP